VRGRRLCVGHRRRERRRARSPADGDSPCRGPRLTTGGERLPVGRGQRRRRDLLQLGSGRRRLVGPERSRTPAAHPAAPQHQAGDRLRDRERPRRQGLRDPLRRRQRQRECG
jgi:hypothetical protein